MIIVDTGFWLGLLKKRDAHHRVCRSFLAKCREPLASTFPVLTEATHLLTQMRGTHAMLELLDLLAKLRTASSFTCFTLNDSHLPRITQLMRQYADLPMDLADASLVVLAEHLGHGRIVSTDRRDFQSYRWKNRHPFTNLLEPLP